VRNLPEIPIQPFGAVIPVQLVVGVGRWQALRAEGRTAPDPVSVTLLIDTGATCSWVRPAYMTQLGLTPRSWIDVETANGVEENQPAYDISLVLGGFGTANARRFETLIGAKEFPDMPFDGLLGRNILTYIHLAWNGPSANLRVHYE
jgi:hypothetical protein